MLLNLSASNITIGKADDRRLLCGSQSMRCIAACAYSAAGPGESTTDLAWDGHAGIFENGLPLAPWQRRSAFPPARPWPSRMSISVGCAKSECDVLPSEIVHVIASTEMQVTVPFVP